MDTVDYNTIFVLAIINGFAVVGQSQSQADLCSSAPCRNDGSCSHDGFNFTCQCPPEYQGVTCQIDVDECQNDNVTCFNNGSCVNNSGHYLCACPVGHTGSYCESEYQLPAASEDMSDKQRIVVIIAVVVIVAAVLLIVVVAVILCKSLQKRTRNRLKISKKKLQNGEHEMSYGHTDSLNVRLLHGTNPMMGSRDSTDPMCPGVAYGDENGPEYVNTSRAHLPTIKRNADKNIKDRPPTYDVVSPLYDSVSPTNGKLVSSEGQQRYYSLERSPGEDSPDSEIPLYSEAYVPRDAVEDLLKLNAATLDTRLSSGTYDVPITSPQVETRDCNGYSTPKSQPVRV